LSTYDNQPFGSVGDPRLDCDLVQFSEDALGVEFINAYGDVVRSIPASGQWRIWDGKRWRPDQRQTAYGLARKVVRAEAKTANGDGERKTLNSRRTYRNVEYLGMVDMRVVTTPEMWDADPWVLNTPTGTVKLKSGNTRAHAREDYLTKITAVGPDPNCPFVVWRRFLDEITVGDAAFQHYLQMVAGYCLTGITNEHALFFAYGHGGNGKGVFTRAITGVMGDYHASAPIETFTSSTLDRHPTELAGLCGARIVTATETEANRPWAESKIKMMTGGDPIAARYMRQDFFSYVPQFKLFLSGNHRPPIRCPDEAIRRRLHLIPFMAEIGPDRRDPQLDDKLRKEWPGILNWAIQGCIAWQAEGLAKPHVVIVATEDYLSGQDTIIAWMDDVGERVTGHFEPIADLWLSFQQWCERSDEQPYTRRTFQDNIERHGLRRKRTNASHGFTGLRLRRQG